MTFLDMDLQHLQPGVAHPPELPVRSGVLCMAIFSVDLGGSVTSFSFALTSLLPIVLDLLRLRHGLGTWASSVMVGFIIDLISLTSRSGVNWITRKVS